MSDKLTDAIAAAQPKGKAAKARVVKVKPKSGRPSSGKREAVRGPTPTYTATELADAIGYQRDTIYAWQEQGFTPTEIVGNVRRWSIPAAFRFAISRAERPLSAGEVEEELEMEKLRKMRAQADMVEDERDKQRKRLLEVDAVIAVYEDDSAHVAAHLRPIGAALAHDLAIEDSPTRIQLMIDKRIEQALLHLNSGHVDPECEQCHPYLGGRDVEAEI